MYPVCALSAVMETMFVRSRTEATVVFNGNEPFDVPGLIRRKSSTIDVCIRHRDGFRSPRIINGIRTGV
jgi:hypothetical protein